jgi:hypothetical protein
MAYPDVYSISVSLYIFKPSDIKLLSFKSRQKRKLIFSNEDEKITNKSLEGGIFVIKVNAD